MLSLVLSLVLPIMLHLMLSRVISFMLPRSAISCAVLCWQERNYMWFLLLMGVCFLAIPIHHEYTLPVW